MSSENIENCLFDDTERIKILIDKIKEIKKQYGFPLWLIKEALEYYDEDEDRAIKKLIEIYRAIGDNPDITIRRNIEKFMGEVIEKEVPPPDVEELFSKNLKNINY